jgi:hypothetical protein
MWERSFPPNNHRQRKYNVKYLPHCKFDEFRPPFYVAYGNTQWIIVCTFDESSTLTWECAVAKTKHTGAFEWWFTEKSVSLAPRYVPLPLFRVQKDQTVSDALKQNGLFPSRSPAPVAWESQPLYIKQFWRATVGRVLGVSIKLPLKQASALSVYIDQHIPTQWLPKFQHVYTTEKLNPSSNNGVFLRLIELCYTYAQKGILLWSEDVYYIFVRVFLRISVATWFRAPWIRPNRDKLFDVYLCEDLCEQIWTAKPIPKASFTYQPSILPRLFNELVLNSDFTKEIQLTGQLNLHACILSTETFNWGMIRDDLFTIGVRRFKFPTAIRRYPSPMQQTKHHYYFSEPPFRKVVHGNLIDPNYIEINGPVSFRLQALRMDYPVLPLIPKQYGYLLKCLHSAIWDCEFMASIPWCSTGNPIVFEECGKYYMSTAYCRINIQ